MKLTHLNSRNALQRNASGKWVSWVSFAPICLLSISIIIFFNQPGIAVKNSPNSPIWVKSDSLNHLEMGEFCLFSRK